jgi:hypothetical protein
VNRFAKRERALIAQELAADEAPAHRHLGLSFQGPSIGAASVAVCAHGEADHEKQCCSRTVPVYGSCVKPSGE